MSKAFIGQGPRIAHLSLGEVADLRADVDAAFAISDTRVDYPTVKKVTGGSAVSLSGTSAGVVAGIVGIGLIQSKERAVLVVGTGTSRLTFNANRPGTPGNDISVAITDSGSSGLAVTVNASAITINLGAATVTAAQAKAAFDLVPAAVKLATCTSGGAGNIAVAALTHLAGGTGTGLLVVANGIEQAVIGAVTDTAIPMVVTDLTGSANGDTVEFHVVSNDVVSNSMTLGVVT